MRTQKDAVLMGLLGFALTSAFMLPPIIASEAERTARIAAHDAAAGSQGVTFGRERSARLTYLLRHMDEAERGRIERK
ncbi:hypothetical protein [Erythrobacter donghaensis]|jgi:hypothetical protein|uniref:hypothetical protein n=1 Tax=Erythrobacter donghaensis TaxID=267135 RepID=UPI00093C48E6|nr:hypothetical protein [Erythrobacter donghaensis]